MFNITDLSEIRIIINTGRGFGHQRAALTLMLKLRELGFNGIFDIWYHDIYPQSSRIFEVALNTGRIGRVLHLLIPDFIPKSLSVIDEGQELENIYGRLKITRLPNSTFQLPPTCLTMTAGDDMHSFEQTTKITQYSTQYYVCLEPTDWDTEYRFVKLPNSKFIYLPKNSRLSSIRNIYSLARRPEDNALQLLTARLNGLKIMTQLVYGLYPDYIKIRDKIIKTANLNIGLELKRLIDAHSLLIAKNPEYSTLLIFPQDICLFDTESSLHKEFLNYAIKNSIDLRVISNISLFPEVPEPNCIYLLYSGYLNPAVFEDIMLRSTTLPPVIEGCNSIEACEKNARLYLHGSDHMTQINSYCYGETCSEFSLHKSACSPLETGIKSHVPALAKFMDLFYKGKLTAYAHVRQQAHLERPDIVETALDIIQKYSLRHLKLEETKKLITPSISSIPTRLLTYMAPRQTAPSSTMPGNISSFLNRIFR